MSAFPEPPFNDFEERYFLAEVIKRSPVPTSILVNVVRRAGIEPAWMEIALPTGRSVSACQNAFQALLARTPVEVVLQPDLGQNILKRPYPGAGDANPNLNREIQPRPPTFASVNGQQQLITAATTTTAAPVPMSPIGPARKKRGRPTKAEFERRQSEAMARGEVWPKPRKAKTPRVSFDGPETPARTSQATAATESASPAVAHTPISSAGEGSPILGNAPAAQPVNIYSPVPGSLPRITSPNARSRSLSGSQPPSQVLGASQGYGASPAKQAPASSYQTPILLPAFGQNRLPPGSSPVQRITEQSPAGSQGSYSARPHGLPVQSFASSDRPPTAPSEQQHQA